MQNRFEAKVLKERFLKLLPFFLIFLGVAVIVSVLVMKWQVNKEQKSLIEAYNNALNEEAQRMDTEASQTEISASEASADGNEADRIKPICLLEIPKIDLYVAVAEGVDKSTLRYAVGHFPSTAYAGDLGNFCLVGHRSYAYGEFFNRLDEIEAGDEIYVERNEIRYTYTVTEKFVVNPEDTWVLNKTTDSEITLITCTPIRVATQRLIIKGILKSSSES